MPKPSDCRPVRYIGVLAATIQTVLCLILLLAPRCALAAEQKHILVLYSNNRLLPANVEGDRGFNEAIARSAEPVVVSTEFLDYPRFGGDDYVRTVTTYLRDKYRALPPDVIVVAGEEAIDFVLENRAAFYPGVPVVHMGVNRGKIAEMTLPEDVVGSPVEYEYAGTVEQALRWHPKATRLVVVTGTAPADRDIEQRLRRDFGKFAGRLQQIEFWAGLAWSELRTRLAALGPDTLIFTPGYFRDGDGRELTPRAAATEIAAAAPVPVYSPYNTFVGTGIVGGLVPTFYDMGRIGGETGLQILSGRRAQELNLPPSVPTTLSVDARQLERWGIPESAVPAGALVQFRTPGFWEQYRVPALVAIAAFFIQSLLLAGLLLERRRRHAAEADAHRHRFDLAHASRLALAGELTASIAHEINQPLAAIMNNAATALMILDKGTGRLSDLRPIVDDIRRDNMRANDVIRQLRRMLEKHEVEREPVDLKEVLAGIEIILRGEARRRRIDLSIQSPADGIQILGDRIQLQQIFLNLALNAMDALNDRSEGPRLVSLEVETSGGSVHVRISDNGHGIDPRHQNRLFDSFFSTKPGGIGLGLSIVRTLVTSHGGRVWADNRPEGGATFHVDLPLTNVHQTMEVA